MPIAGTRLAVWTVLQFASLSSLNEEDRMDHGRREVNVLLVEDNPDHNQISWVRDGEVLTNLLPDGEQ